MGLLLVIVHHQPGHLPSRALADPNAKIRQMIENFVIFLCGISKEKNIVKSHHTENLRLLVPQDPQRIVWVLADISGTNQADNIT